MAESEGLSKRQPRWIFPAFLVASAVAHAVISVGISPPAPEAAPSVPASLAASMEVSILPPEAVIAAPVERLPQRQSQPRATRTPGAAPLVREQRDAAAT